MGHGGGMAGTFLTPEEKNRAERIWLDIVGLFGGRSVEDMVAEVLLSFPDDLKITAADCDFIKRPAVQSAFFCRVDLDLSTFRDERLPGLRDKKAAPWQLLAPPFLPQDKAYVRAVASAGDPAPDGLPCWWVGTVLEVRKKEMEALVQTELQAVRGQPGFWADGLRDVIPLERDGVVAAGLGGPCTAAAVNLKTLYCGEEERFLTMRTTRGAVPGHWEFYEMWRKGKGKGKSGRTCLECNPWGEIPGAKWQQGPHGDWTYGKQHQWHYESEGERKESGGKWARYFDATD
eukprot:g17754.t1